MHPLPDAAGKAPAGRTALGVSVIPYGDAGGRPGGARLVSGATGTGQRRGGRGAGDGAGTRRGTGP